MVTSPTGVAALETQKPSFSAVNFARYYDGETDGRARPDRARRANPILQEPRDALTRRPSIMACPNQLMRVSALCRRPRRARSRSRTAARPKLETGCIGHIPGVAHMAHPHL